MMLIAQTDKQNYKGDNSNVSKEQCGMSILLLLCVRLCVLPPPGIHQWSQQGD